MILTPSQESLVEFVTHWHGDQKRKYTGDPYIKHLFAVVEKLPKTQTFFAIGFCHDILEDTDCTPDQLYWQLKERCRFHEPVIKTIMEAVIDLTDVYTSINFPTLNREKRKELEAKRLSRTSSIAQTVKYADIIDNLENILPYNRGFAEKFAVEMQYTLSGMDKGDRFLYSKCVQAIESAFKPIEDAESTRKIQSYQRQ